MYTDLSWKCVSLRNIAIGSLHFMGLYLCLVANFVELSNFLAHLCSCTLGSYASPSVCPSGLVERTPCTTSMVQSYVVHNQPVLCTTDRLCNLSSQMFFFCWETWILQVLSNKNPKGRLAHNNLKLHHSLFYFTFSGEHIKNWRKRYFILLDDGCFYGFKDKPVNFKQDPLNNFTVKGTIILL